MAGLVTKTAEAANLANEPGGSRHDSSGGKAYAATPSNDGQVASASKMQKDYLETQSQRATQRNHAAKVKQADLILFTTQLSVMLDSGVVLSDALDAIAEQQPDQSTFKAIITDVADSVKSGDNFSKALVAYPRAFNSMFISMVKASEASGQMAEMLKVLSGYLSFESETRKRIKGALTYPFIMALMAVAATGTLMFFVLPRFMKIYETRGAALPKITQVLVGFSKALGDFEIMTGVVTALIVTFMGLYYWTRTLA
ncbi:MAG: type II secretion system F family protein, partial [Planctomycetota bacterium]